MAKPCQRVDGESTRSSPSPTSSKDVSSHDGIRCAGRHRAAGCLLFTRRPRLHPQGLPNCCWHELFPLGCLSVSALYSPQHIFIGGFFAGACSILSQGLHPTSWLPLASIVGDGRHVESFTAFIDGLDRDFNPALLALAGTSHRLRDQPLHHLGLFDLRFRPPSSVAVDLRALHFHQERGGDSRRPPRGIGIDPPPNASA